MSDDGAKILAEWLGYAWDGLGDQDISDRYPDWSYGGCGHKSPQGGKPAFRKIVQAITAAERDEAARRADAAEAQVAALTAKVDALCSKGQCGCSWDSEGDVCEYHSPKLVAALAQVDALREALERPTPEMKMAGYRVTGNYDIAHDCWAQMARAALEPAGKETGQ